MKTLNGLNLVDWKPDIDMRITRDMNWIGQDCSMFLSVANVLAALNKNSASTLVDFYTIGLSRSGELSRLYSGDRELRDIVVCDKLRFIQLRPLKT